MIQPSPVLAWKQVPLIGSSTYYAITKILLMRCSGNEMNQQFTGHGCFRPKKCINLNTNNNMKWQLFLFRKALHYADPRFRRYFQNYITWGWYYFHETRFSHYIFCFAVRSCMDHGSWDFVMWAGSRALNIYFVVRSCGSWLLKVFFLTHDRRDVES